MSILTRVQYRGRSLSTPISVTSSTVTLVANRTDSFDQSSNSTCNYSNTKENRKKSLYYYMLFLHRFQSMIAVNMWLPLRECLGTSQYPWVHVLVHEILPINMILSCIYINTYTMMKPYLKEKRRVYIVQYNYALGHRSIFFFYH